MLMPGLAALALGVGPALLGGCVRRTISITSEPEGALCWLNGREVGRTPLLVDFTYYGDYDVVLEKDGYEPLLTMGKAAAPLWDTVPLDFIAELAPADLHSEFRWHYELQPRNDDPAMLIERARELRQRTDGPAAPATAPVEPASAPAEPRASDPATPAS